MTDKAIEAYAKVLLEAADFQVCEDEMEWARQSVTALMEHVRGEAQEPLQMLLGVLAEFADDPPKKADDIFKDCPPAIHQLFCQMCETMGHARDQLQVLSLLGTGWRDMESAPRDGTPILCFQKGNPKADIPAARKDWMKVDVRDREWPNFKYQFPEAPYTKWHPLPTQPTEEKNGE